MHKVQEFVCWLERVNHRKYWPDLKKKSTLYSPFIKEGSKTKEGKHHAKTNGKGAPLKNVTYTGENYYVTGKKRRN